MPNPYVIVAVLLAFGTACFGTFVVGRKYERADWQAQEITRADKIIVKDREIIKEVPKIVTKVVEKRVLVTQEVERVVTKIPDLVSADCVLPDNYGMLLVAAANGLDPASARGIDAITGEYGCREVLEATIKDLAAGYKNTNTLAGLQAYEQLIESDKPPAK